MDQLKKKKGFICDMDGVLYHGNQLLPGVVNQLSVLVDEVEVAPVGQADIPAYLLDAAEAHVHQQNAALGDAVPGKLDVVA